MTEFITGLVLGGLLMFCLCEYHRWKSAFITGSMPKEKSTENTQWHNLLSYDGSERGQMKLED